MKKPNTLSQLLEELQGEDIHTDVEVMKTSKAVVYLNDEAAENEDSIELTGKECSLLLANVATAERFIDALDGAGDAAISLFDLTVSSPVLELLERNFNTVDEG